MKLAALRALSSGPMRRIARPLMRDRATIFMLHRLADPGNGVHGHEAHAVRTMLDELRRSGARFISLRQMFEDWRRERRCDPDAIAFTMDDGFADQGQLAREAFIPAGIPVTVFLISGFLDGRLWPWDDQLATAFRQTPRSSATVRVGSETIALDLDSSDARERALHKVRSLCKRSDNSELYQTVAAIAAALDVALPAEPPAGYKPLTWDEARELERLGVEFGPHSISHRIFSQLPDDMARTEIEGSWQRLREELRNPVPVMAWPTGRSKDFSPRDIRLATDAGLLGCVATNSDYAHFPRDAGSGMFSICRFPLPDDVVTTLRYGSWIERARQFLPG